MTVGLFQFVSTDEEVRALSYDRLLEVIKAHCRDVDQKCLDVIVKELHEITFPKNIVASEELWDTILRSNYFFTFRHEGGRKVLLNVVLRSGDIHLLESDGVMHINTSAMQTRLNIEGKLRLDVSMDGYIHGVANVDEDVYPRPLRKVEWGKTPLDQLTPNELRRQCQRLYAATEAMYQELGKIRTQIDPEEKDPYWNTGLGAIALEKGRQAIHHVRKDYDPVSMRSSFFTFANDLLFQNTPTLKLKHDWMSCDLCHSKAVGTTLFGKKCPEAFPETAKQRIADGEPLCSGHMKHLSWSDFKPDAKPVIVQMK